MNQLTSFVRETREEVLRHSSPAFWSGSAMLMLSSLLRTAALFLPIKILLMVNGGSGPSYLQYLPIDPDLFLLFLGLCIPLLYGASIVASSFFQHVVDAAVQPAPVRMRHKHFITFYSRLGQTVADIMTVAAGWLAIMVCSVQVGLGFLLNIAAFALIISWLVHDPNNERISKLRILPNQMVEYVGAVAFLLHFAVLAVVLTTTHLNIILAMLCILAGRLSLQATQRILKAMLRHSRNRRNIAAEQEELET